MSRRVREQPVDMAQGVVAGGARDRPGGGQPLPVREDLLDHRPPAAARPVQPVQVGVGVGEAVGVVDAQPVDHPSRSSRSTVACVASKTSGSSTRTPISSEMLKNRR